MSREEISNQYLEAVERMHAWCEKNDKNFRLEMAAIIERHIAPPRKAVTPSTTLRPRIRNLACDAYPGELFTVRELADRVGASNKVMSVQVSPSQRYADGMSRYKGMKIWRVNDE